MNGRIAEAAVWNTDLTADEIASLGADRVSPLLIRPDNLIAYWPIIGRTSPEINLMGSGNLTLGGSPATADHCRIYYGSEPIKMGVPAAAPAASTAYFLPLLGVG